MITAINSGQSLSPPSPATGQSTFLPRSAFSTEKIRGVQTRFALYGSGSDVVILHGWGGSIESMAPLFPGLLKHHRILTLDFPGHGSSSAPHTPWGTSEFAQHVLSLMKRCGISQAAVVGHSFGGRVGIQMASSAADYITRLVLISSAGLPNPRTWRYYLKLNFVRLAKLLSSVLGPFGDSFKQRVYKVVGSSDYLAAGSLRPSFVRIVNENLRGLLPTLTCPTLLIWGQNDTATPLVSGEIMARAISGSKLVVLQNVGHFPHVERPGRVALELDHFLRNSQS